MKKLVLILSVLLITSNCYAEIPADKIATVQNSMGYGFIGVSVIVLIIYLMRNGREQLFDDYKQSFVYVLVLLATLGGFYLVFKNKGF
jgi:NADH:ubiquinone oxidoreductase subunit 2 (subunit N)